MAKVQKSLRIDADLAERLRDLTQPGESEAATYNRVIEAGLDSLEHGELMAKAPKYEELLASKEEELERLRKALADSDARAQAATEQHAWLKAQLETKDQQISAAQATAALAVQRIQQPGGLFSRLLGRGKTEQQEPERKAKWNA